MKIYAFADEANPSVDGQIVAMTRNGLNGLEIRGVDGTNVAEITLEKAREVRAKMDAAGLETWSIGSPIGKIDIEKDDFEAHMDKFRHTLEVAKILGAKNIRLFSFFIPEGKEAASYKEEVIRRLKCFVEAAAGTGIDLCHENEKGIYGDIAVRCLEIHQEVPELKAIFDPANYIQCGQNTLEAWAMLKPYVKYMHIKDAFLADGAVVPAGEGDGNVPEILAELNKSDKTYMLTLEPHLAVFSGLKGLQDEELTHKYTYESNEKAFDAAVNALKAILEKIA